MPPAIVGALVAGGLGIAAAKAGKPDPAIPAPTTFESLPAPAQEITLEQILPALQSILQQPQTQQVTKRAVSPTVDPFASRGAFDLQQAQDLLGGTRTIRNPLQDLIGTFRSSQPFMPPGEVSGQIDFESLPRVVQGLGFQNIGFRPGDQEFGDQFQPGAIEGTLNIPNTIGNAFFNFLNQPEKASNLISGGVRFDPSRNLFVLQGNQGLIGVNTSGQVVDLTTGEPTGVSAVNPQGGFLETPGPQDFSGQDLANQFLSTLQQSPQGLDQLLQGSTQPQQVDVAGLLQNLGGLV